MNCSAKPMNCGEEVPLLRLAGVEGHAGRAFIAMETSYRNHVARLKSKVDIKLIFQSANDLRIP